MDFSQNNISANNSNSFGLQANFLNKKSGGLNFGMKTNNNQSAYYLKKLYIRLETKRCNKGSVSKPVRWYKFTNSTILT